MFVGGFVAVLLVIRQANGVETDVATIDLALETPFALGPRLAQQPAGGRQHIERALAVEALDRLAESTGCQQVRQPAVDHLGVPRALTTQQPTVAVVDSGEAGIAMPLDEIANSVQDLRRLGVAAAARVPPHQEGIGRRLGRRARMPSR